MKETLLDTLGVYFYKYLDFILTVSAYFNKVLGIQYVQKYPNSVTFFLFA